MNYTEAKEYLDSTNKYGSVLGLNTIKELLKRLDNPQDKLKVVHFAGTNGKGSTMAYLESILLCAGYSVGKYNSPVVFDVMRKGTFARRSLLLCPALTSSRSPLNT